MDKIQLEQQIDRFINNEMSASEHQEFCKRLEADNDLKKQVELRMILIEGELIRAEEKALAAMKASGRSDMGRRHSERTFRWSWLAAACVILLLVGIGYVGNSYQYSPQNINRMYYEIPIIERTRGGGLPEQIASYNRQIIDYYENGQYKEIVALYQRENLSEEKDNFPVHTLLYISIALIEQQHAQEAIPLLQPLVATPYQEEAEWLLLSCYLETNNRQSAIQLADKIIKRNGMFSEKAILIENSLKEKRWF